MAGEETVILKNPENERGPVTIELVWDPETSKGSLPAEVMSKLKGIIEAKTYNAEFTSGTENGMHRYRPAYKYYKFYIAFQGGNPIGGISVLKDTNYISFLRADGEDVYNALLEYYKTNINPADTNPTEKLVPTSTPFDPWDRLTAKQKQPPFFVNERDRYEGVGRDPRTGLSLLPNAYMRNLELPPPSSTLGEPKERSVVPPVVFPKRSLVNTLLGKKEQPPEVPPRMGPTPVEDQAPMKVFRGGTRRRRNLRKRNRKTRKWTSSATRKRN